MVTNKIRDQDKKLPWFNVFFLFIFIFWDLKKTCTTCKNNCVQTWSRCINAQPGIDRTVHFRVYKHLLCKHAIANVHISKWLHISPSVSQQNEFLLIVHAVLASQPLYSFYFPRLHTVHIITYCVNTCRFVKYILCIHLQFLRRKIFLKTSWV